MPMTPVRMSMRALALSALVAAAVTTAAPAEVRAPIRDCGDIGDASDAGAYAITAQGRGLTCRSARALARAVTPKRSCRTNGSCTVRGFVCLVAQAGKELYLASCETTGPSRRFVRFEFGS